MQAFIHPTLSKLFDGIKGFQQRFYGLHSTDMQHLVEHGQRPKVLLIACSDSRVDPALLTDAAPGDLFVLRNVANLVPPYCLEGKYDSARSAIEYAVRDLAVEHIVILGHAHCGGIQALLNTLSGQKPQRDFIGDWVSIAMDGCCRYAVDQLGGAEADNSGLVREVDIDSLRTHQHLVERASIRGSLDNLCSYPWIKERVDTGKLGLHGWWFDLETGDLWATNEDNTAFLPVIE
ncbi:MAG: carbonic anhydrase [Methylovulum sp.]|nr:carbonic anhydrase [Methylovulum sp.]